MSYTKNSWSTGDTITATKLNHLEQGVYDASEGAGGTVRVPFTVSVDEQGHLTATTTAEIGAVMAAVTAGKQVVADVTSPSGVVYHASLTAHNSTHLIFDVITQEDMDVMTATLYHIGWTTGEVAFAMSSISLS